MGDDIYLDAGEELQKLSLLLQIGPKTKDELRCIVARLETVSTMLLKRLPPALPDEFRKKAA